VDPGLSPQFIGESGGCGFAEKAPFVVARTTGSGQFVADLADSETRINAVLQRSDADAARTLRDLWSSTNPDYPITVYGKDAKIDVVIRSVNQIDSGVAQVRFTKTLRKPRDTRTVTRPYVATLAYDFRPETRQRLQQVWANPLGFVVTSYRVDAEALGAE